MTVSGRRTVFWALIVAVGVSVFWVPPIRELENYFQFADDRSYFCIPNFWNVVSNIPFFILGVAGAWQVLKAWLGLPYFAFFVAIFLTGLGSAYFHWDVNSDTLFWDRLPIALALMAFVAAAIDDYIHPRVGTLALVPLLALGAVSVLMWYASVQSGEADLRYYALVQYGSLVVVVCLLLFFTPPYTQNKYVWMALGSFVVAKIAEVFDAQIFQFWGLVSGHTIKHLVASMGAYWILRMLKVRGAHQIVS